MTNSLPESTRLSALISALSHWSLGFDWDLGFGHWDLQLHLHNNLLPRYHQPPMQRRTFGDTSLEVSAISLGCWIFGVDWWGHYTQERANQMCQFSFDHGITFFDNGDAYGNGRAETLFAEFLKQSGIRRDKIEIGSKFGYDFYTDPGEAGSHRERRQDFSPAFLRSSVEKSLQRLNTDYIDLYMAHNIKLPQFRDDLFAELEKIKNEGKIKVWGVSLGPAIGWREEGFKAVMDHNAKAIQTVFNLFEQNPGREFCEVAHAYKAGVTARVHDNSSILKDVVKVDTEIAANDHRKFRDDAWKIYGLKKLELVRHYATDHGMTVHQLACKWLLQQTALTAITGTFLNENEIREACEAVDKPNLLWQELTQITEDYARDFGLGSEAHPCDLKSSVDVSGRVKSGYVPAPVLIA
jgi:aryl-alcohol dehydrogenase-like predicted oxidoreductase